MKTKLKPRARRTGEVYYNIAIAPSLHVPLDAQVIDSALLRIDTTWAFGLRTHVDF